MHEQVGDLHIAFLTDLCRNRVQGSLASNGGTITNTGLIYVFHSKWITCIIESGVFSIEISQMRTVQLLWITTP